MKRATLALLSSLAIALVLSACSGLNKDISVRTIGGEKKTLSIKAPKQFKQDKEAYFIFYSVFYMTAWNKGVDESKKPKAEYKFDVDRFVKGYVGTIQGNPYILEDMEKYFKKQKSLEEKFKAEGRAFANKQKK